MARLAKKMGELDGLSVQKKWGKKMLIIDPHISPVLFSCAA